MEVGNMKLHMYIIFIIIEYELFLRHDILIDWNDLPVMPYRIKHYGHALVLPDIPEASVLKNVDFGLCCPGEVLDSSIIEV